jgi:hypothetical protein
MNDIMGKTVDSTEKDNKERWEFSKEIGKLCVRKVVEKIDDGFLLTTNVYGKKEGSDEYIDKTNKSFHKENPLADMIKDTNDESSKEEAKSSTDTAFNPFDISNFIKK